MSRNNDEDDDIILFDAENEVYTYDEDDEEEEEEDDRSKISDLIVSDSEVEREIELAEMLSRDDTSDGINPSNIIHGSRRRRAPRTFYDEYKDDLINVIVSDDEELEVVRNESSFTIQNEDLAGDDDDDDDEDYLPDDDMDES